MASARGCQIGLRVEQRIPAGRRIARYRCHEDGAVERRIAFGTLRSGRSGVAFWPRQPGSPLGPVDQLARLRPSLLCHPSDLEPRLALVVPRTLTGPEDPMRQADLGRLVLPSLPAVPSVRCHLWAPPASVAMASTFLGRCALVRLPRRQANAKRVPGQPSSRQFTAVLESRC